MTVFIFFFSFFILIFTVFSNTLIWIISLFICFITVWIINKFNPRINLKKISFYLILAFTLSLLSVLWKDYRYSSKPDTSILSNFIWTWNIQNTYTAWRYIFSHSNHNYILYSDNGYNIGDQIFISWKFKANQMETLKFGIKEFGPAVAGLSRWRRDSLRSALLGIKELWNKGIQDTGTFDYDKRFLMKNYYGTLREDSSIKITTNKITDDKQRITEDEKMELGNKGIGELKNNLWVISKLRRNLQESIIQAYGKNRITWLILWLLIGDRSQIPPWDYSNFINSWLVHIIAVSGGNIIMIVIFLWLILFFLPFYIRNFVILISIIFYWLICWLDSSVFRAAVMWWLWILALFRWKEINIRRAMSISFILLLFINPYYLVYDIGFLFSFAAVIGIIYLNEKTKTLELGNNNLELGNNNFMIKIVKLKNKKIKSAFKYFFQNYIIPSLWATFGIFPIMIFFMWKINLISIVWNLFILPLVPFLMIYWFIGTFIFNLFWSQRILLPEKILINYVYWISNLISQYWIYLTVDSQRLKYLILILFLIWFVKRRTSPPTPLPEIGEERI